MCFAYKIVLQKQQTKNGKDFVFIYIFNYFCIIRYDFPLCKWLQLPQESLFTPFENNKFHDQPSNQQVDLCHDVASTLIRRCLDVECPLKYPLILLVGRETTPPFSKNLCFAAGAALKAPFLKNRLFFSIQERFKNWYIVFIKTCGIGQPVKFHLVSPFWTGSKMKWFLSYLWINVGNIIFRDTIKNHFISRTRGWLKFYRLSGVTFYDCVNTIYQFIKLFLDTKISTLRNMEPLSIVMAHTT